MSNLSRSRASSRRRFLQTLAVGAGGVVFAGGAARSFAAGVAAPPADTAHWANHIGLELWTVRDQLSKDYVGTLQRVAEMGYKEIEPATGYGNLSPKQFRTAIDKLGLSMPSTHSGLTTGPQAAVDRQLEGFQIMGLQYVSLGEAPPAGARRGARGGRAGRGRGGARRGARGNPSPAAMRAMFAAMARPRSVDDVKREADQLNQYGKMAQKYGIQILRHNHTVEFVPCIGTTQLPYTILLAETDPSLVVFQMDIGLLVAAGQDPIAWFHRNPGRFVLWHVKDVANLQSLPPVADEGARQVEAEQVPVGEGEINYRLIFQHAALAGMKHFDVEQNARPGSNTLTDARLSYDYLHRMLTIGV